MGGPNLTFTVELEFVFAFTERSLLPVIQETDFGPVKNIPHYIRNGHPFNTLGLTPNRPYNSWGILRNDFSGDDSKNFPNQRLVALRPYGNEPLRLCRAAIKALPFSVDRQSNIGPAAKVENQNQEWHVTKDDAVRGVGPGTLFASLSDRISSESMHTWDSYGLRTVSRVMGTDSPADIEQIRLMVEALKGSKESDHGAFVTNHTGFHVHVDAPPDFQVTKMLLYLVFLYEDAIKSIHPPCRQDDHTLQATAQNAATNGSAYDKFPNDERAWEWLQGIQDEGAFAENAGGKENYVNFIYGIRQALHSRTIEFCQHRGSLNFDEIRYWVMFVTKLVQLAASLPLTRRPATSCESKSDIKHLMEKMQMPEDAIQYYLDKRALYTDYEADHPNGPLISSNSKQASSPRDIKAKIFTRLGRWTEPDEFVYSKNPHLSPLPSSPESSHSSQGRRASLSNTVKSDNPRTSSTHGSGTPNESPVPNNSTNRSGRTQMNDALAADHKSGEKRPIGTESSSRKSLQIIVEKECNH
jgi:hypothetical protein